MALSLKTSVLKASAPSGAESTAMVKTVMMKKINCFSVTRTKCNKSNGKRTGVFTRMRISTVKIANGMTMMNMRVSFSYLDSLLCSLFCLLLASSHTSATSNLKTPKSTKSRLTSPS